MEKLECSAFRLESMIDYVRAKMGGIVDVVVSNVGPEATRLGYGLGAKVCTWNDMPEAEALTRLTTPLSTWIFTPWIIPPQEFIRYGVPDERIFRYHALYPMAYLPEIEVEQNIMGRLGIHDFYDVIVFSESETRASYLIGKQDIVVEAVKVLAEEMPEAIFLARPRYSAEELRRNFYDQPNVHIFSEPIDMQSLVAKADLLIGGGATLNIEAAYYGTPVIACRPITCRYEQFLLDRWLAVKAHTVDEVVSLAYELLGKRNDDKARQVFDKMKYPLDEIIKIIEE